MTPSSKTEKSAEQKTLALTKYYFDTSVLLPVLIKQHETHDLCKERLKTAIQSKGAIVTSTHTYAELYRHLTRNRPPYDLSPENAALALLDNLSKLLEIIDLDENDYNVAIRRCEKLELTGAVIYDALHYQAALKAGAAVIYTDNTKDFIRLQLEGESINIEGIR